MASEPQHPPQFMQPSSNQNCSLNEGVNWFGYMVNGVAQIGHKERLNLRMLLVLILLRHVTMHLIVRVDRMTKTVLQEDAHVQEMTNSLLQH